MSQYVEIMFQDVGINLRRYITAQPTNSSTCLCWE